MTNGAPAEVGTGGVYMNMVTKSGGNAFSGASSIYWEDKSFQGDNISSELRAQGITGNPINFLYTLTTEADGRFNFAAFAPGRYTIRAELSGFGGQETPDISGAKTPPCSQRW